MSVLSHRFVLRCILQAAKHLFLLEKDQIKDFFLDNLEIVPVLQISLSQSPALVVTLALASVIVLAKRCTLMCLSIGTPKINAFSICSKWKIHYFQVSQNLGRVQPHYNLFEYWDT